MTADASRLDVLINVLIVVPVVVLAVVLINVLINVLIGRVIELTRNVLKVTSGPLVVLLWCLSGLSTEFPHFLSSIACQARKRRKASACWAWNSTDASHLWCKKQPYFNLTGRDLIYCPDIPNDPLGQDIPNDH